MEKIKIEAKTKIIFFKYKQAYALLFIWHENVDMLKPDILCIYFTEKFRKAFKQAIVCAPAYHDATAATSRTYLAKSNRPHKPAYV